MTNDEAHFKGAMGRVERFMLFVAAAGALVAFVRGGWPALIGFLAGAVGSYLNFRWLRQMVAGFGAATRIRKRHAVLFGLRYLIFGAAVYVIVNFFQISAVAALVGFLTAVGAVIFEILYELTHAGT
jgi:hypothetical protein